MLLEIFSGRCPSCSEGSSLDMPLCDNCISKLATFTSFCGKCGFPLSKDGASCYRCRSKVSKNIRNIYALYQYKSSMRDLILSIKFRYNIRSSLHLYNIINLPNLYTKYDYIVPVPCFILRKFKRFFHPADILADYTSKTLNIPIYKGLKRVRSTNFQSKLLRKERAENIKNAFECKNFPTDAKNILLIDDIFTTGATVSECANILKKQGAKIIDVLVLAK